MKNPLNARFRFQVYTRLNYLRFEISKFFWGGAHRAPPRPLPHSFSGFALDSGFALKSRALRALVSASPDSDPPNFGSVAAPLHHPDINAVDQSLALGIHKSVRLVRTLLDRNFLHHHDRHRHVSANFCHRSHEFRKSACPAASQRCKQCNAIGHFQGSEVCSKARPRTVSYVEDDTGYTEDILSLNDGPYPKRLFANMQVGDSVLSFQLDTGASCNIMPIDIATRVLGHRLNLQRPRRKLQLYDTSELQTLGTITVKLTNPKTAHQYDLDFYITSSGNRTTPLIGAHDCLRMNLLCVNAHSIAALSEHDAPSTDEATSCVKRASEPVA